MYQYFTLADETEITHSHLIVNSGVSEVEVHFERPISTGFDSARCLLPSYKWILREGFTDEEILMFTQMLKCNAHLLYKYAESGGVRIA